MRAPVLVKQTLYECRECGSMYEDEAAAVKCCWHYQYEKVTRWECPDCEAVYDEPEDARACCSDEIEVTALCPECKTSFTGRDVDVVREAQRCCQDPESRTVYTCSQCGDQYSDKEEADICCLRADVVQGYDCGQCGSRYNDKSAATTCCA